MPADRHAIATTSDASDKDATTATAADAAAARNSSMILLLTSFSREHITTIAFTSASPPCCDVTVT